MQSLALKFNETAVLLRGMSHSECVLNLCVQWETVMWIQRYIQIKSEKGGFYTSELFKYLLLSTESLFGVEALDVSDDVKVITKSVIFFLQLLHLTLSMGQFVFEQLVLIFDLVLKSICNFSFKVCRLPCIWSSVCDWRGSSDPPVLSSELLTPSTSFRFRS